MQEFLACISALFCAQQNILCYQLFSFQSGFLFEKTPNNLGA